MVELIYKIMIIWCAINLPFTFVFYYYKSNLIGTTIFMIGFLILNIIGLFEAHKEDKKRSIGII